MNKSVKKKINFNELKNEQFIKFYKFLFEEEFKSMSNDSKILYCILRDRMSLSIKNISEGKTYWLDKDGYVFIHATINNIMEYMNCGNKKAVKLKKELLKFGLIEDARIGITKPNQIYILDINYLETVENTLKCQNNISRSVKTTFQEVSKQHTNKTELNNTYLNNNNNRNYVNQEVKETQEVKHVVVEEKEIKKISKSELEALKVDIETVVKDKVSITTLKSTIKKHDLKIDDIKYYLCNWNKFEFKTMDNPIGFFLYCCTNKIPFPNKVTGTHSQNTNTIPQEHNFEQRVYSDEYYESLYDNFKDKRIVKAIEDRELQQKDELTEEEIRNSKMIEYYFDE